MLFESSEGFFCDRRMPLPPCLTLRASVGANKWFQPGVRRALHLLAYQLIPLGEPLLPLLTLRKPLLYLVLLRSLSRLTFNIFKIFFAFENLFEAGPGLTVPNWQLEGEAAPPMEHFVCSLFTCAFLPTTISVKSLRLPPHHCTNTCNRDFRFLDSRVGNCHRPPGYISI